MRALDRKLLRDLWASKGQALAIAAVIGAGVAMYTAYLSTFQSLEATLAAYYERNRFAEVFASVKRAPARLAERIEALPGVAAAETRVVVDVTLDVPGMVEPAVGRLLSIPAVRRPTLNDVFLRSGRYLEPDRPDEVLAAESFAVAHGLGPGDSVAAVINGTRRELRIVGLALSPEYIYSIRPGELIPDDRRFGVFWMEQRALAAAFDMEGGFNDVAVDLTPGASEREVIAGLDRLLEPYGAVGAYPRALQLSHFSVWNELQGLQKAGAVVPMIFLAVAAFLLNVVLKRMIAVQREQIAALKALGYGHAALGGHFLKWSLLVAVAGSALGLAGGVALGSGMTGLYNDYFRFPLLDYGLPPGVVVGAVAISLGAAALGTWNAVAGAVRLPPAEAMRPEPPASYRVSRLERLGLGRVLSQAGRMVLRNLQSHPLRTGMAVLGIAFGEALLVVGTFSLDSLDLLTEVQFNLAQRQDVTVSFVEPASPAALHAVTRLPGVLHAEAQRAVPARFVLGHRSRQLAVTGIAPDAELARVVGASMQDVALPPEGLVLSAALAEILGAEPGDELTVEVLEGARPVRRVPVAALVDDLMGLSAYMDSGALHRLMREGPVLSGAALMIDPAAEESLYRKLKLIPAVAGVGLKSAAIRNFQETLAQNLGVMIFFNLLFSGIIAFGVVYNSARISLSERSRELASLRVMGFTRTEISSILLGELAAVTVAALPLGLLLGYGLGALAAEAFETELYRFPLVVTLKTSVFAAFAILAAAAVSGLVVRRRLDRLDLIAVLKTRE